MKTAPSRFLFSAAAVLMALAGPVEAIHYVMFTSIEDYAKKANVILIADCTSIEPLPEIQTGGDCIAHVTVVKTLKGQLAISKLDVRTSEPLIPGAQYLLTSFSPVTPPEFWAHDDLGAVRMPQRLDGLEKMGLEDQLRFIFSARRNRDIPDEEKLLARETALLDKALHPPPPPTPAEILKMVAGEIGNDSFVPTTRVRNIPPKVIQALEEKGRPVRLKKEAADALSPEEIAFRDQQKKGLPFQLADSGEPWNAGDVVTQDIPRRRLIFAGLTGKFYVLEYEHGGRGRHVHLAIFLREDEDYKLAYIGAANEGYPDFQKFKKALLADPSLPTFEASHDL